MPSVQEYMGILNRLNPTTIDEFDGSIREWGGMVGLQCMLDPGFKRELISEGSKLAQSKHAADLVKAFYVLAPYKNESAEAGRAFEMMIRNFKSLQGSSAKKWWQFWK